MRFVSPGLGQFTPSCSVARLTVHLPFAKSSGESSAEGAFTGRTQERRASRFTLLIEWTHNKLSVKPLFEAVG